MNAEKIDYEVDVLESPIPHPISRDITLHAGIPGYCPTPCPHKQGAGGVAGIGSCYCTTMCLHNKGTDEVNQTILCKFGG